MALTASIEEAEGLHVASLILLDLGDTGNYWSIVHDLGDYQDRLKTLSLVSDDIYEVMSIQNVRTSANIN